MRNHISRVLPSINHTSGTLSTHYPTTTTHSGTASSTIMVTPEFPLGIMAMMAAVVGVAVAATRFRNLIRL